MMKKVLLSFILGSLAMVPVYEVDGEKILTGENKQVEATITMDRNNRVHGYVKDNDSTRFFPEKRKVKGVWKSNGVIEVKDKYGYKYKLKPTGKRKIGERKTYGYNYHPHKKRYNGRTKKKN